MMKEEKHNSIKGEIAYGMIWYDIACCGGEMKWIELRIQTPHKFFVQRKERTLALYLRKGHKAETVKKLDDI